MLKIKEAIVVEGRYDKNTLSQLVDGVIVETTGFGIYHNKDLLALLRRLGEKQGLIVLTHQVKHAYIPDRPGKERRKRQPGKEGKLGVEGMSQQVLEQALRQAGATILGEGPRHARSASLTKADLYACGLAGGQGSRERREQLLKKLDLPAHLTPNAMLPILSALYDRQTLLEEMEKL